MFLAEDLQERKNIWKEKHRSCYEEKASNRTVDEQISWYNNALSYSIYAKERTLLPLVFRKKQN